MGEKMAIMVNPGILISDYFESIDESLNTPAFLNDHEKA